MGRARRRWAIVAASAVALAVGGCTPQAKPVPAQVISRQGGLDREAEATLVASPRGRTVTAWIGYGRDIAIHAAVSDDFGQTWAPPQKVANPALRLGSRVAVDPSLASNGTSTWLAWVSATDAGPEGGEARIEVAELAAGAHQFSAPATVAELRDGGDKPWLAR